MKCFTHQKEEKKKQSHSSRGSGTELRFIHLDLNPFLAEILLHFTTLILHHFEHLSIPNMARAQLPRWLGRDAERVPHPSWQPGSSQKSCYSPRSLFGTSHVHPTLFRHRLSASDAHTLCRRTIRMRFAWTSSFGFLNLQHFFVEQFGRIHFSHLTASDWFNWRCVFNIICKDLHFGQAQML